jgi:hypothetical protein
MIKKANSVFSDARIGAYVDLTPARFACSLAMSCPAVYKDDENYVIVGKLITPEDPLMRQRVGPGEAAMEISVELLEGAVRTAIRESGSAAERSTALIGRPSHAELRDVNGPPSHPHVLPR